MEIILHFHFHFKVFPEKKRERKRASAREEEDRAPVQSDDRQRTPSSSLRWSRELQSGDRDPRSRSREAPRWLRSARCFARSRSTLREITPSIAISWRRSRSYEDRDLASVRLRRQSWSTAWSLDWSSRSTAPSNPVVRRSLMIFFLGFVRVFLGLSFPSSFPNTRKYFSENFLKCNQIHVNIFLSEK